MKKNFILAGLAILATLVLLGLLRLENEPTVPVTTEPGDMEPLPPPEVVTTITLASVGDIMAHMPQVNAAFDWQGGEYDFMPSFAPVRPLLADVDIAVANLETTLAGSDQGYSGYPRFNSPATLAAALKWAGFHLVSTANNHALDRGEKGVLHTLDNLAANGLTAVGTYRNWEERQSVTMLEREGHSLAFLAYTYGTNGIPLPKGKEYLVKLIDREEMAQDLARAREEGADWIVVLVHFGNEYHRRRSPEQEELVDFLLSQGADIILGSHPHVLQPVKIFSGETGTRVVAYSQGNFISNQRDRYRDSGMILFITLEKNITRGEKRIKAVEYLPTWVHRYRVYGRLQYRVLPVEEALRDYETEADPYLTAEDWQRLREVWEETVTWVAPEGEIRVRERKR
ncbi:MAG TPA: CapA family protein [Firmicutes bacterium]|nr:CapA family protein [Bacillota bacterium]